MGKQAEARRWEAAAAELAADLGASVRMVMEQHGLDTVPASVEWADFDPTAIAGAVSLLGAAALLPDEALQRTFDRFVEGLRRRLDPAQQWTNYSPYEVRVVGALARMGRRDDANLLLDALLADRRPAAWNQWPEILWRDAESPAHLGDLPHCWIGAEFWIALRTLLAYEREEDGVLVLGAGMRREWLDAGVEACGLPTWWGPLDVSVRLDGDRYRVRASGGAAPPGGFAWQLPRPFVQE